MAENAIFASARITLGESKKRPVRAISIGACVIATTLSLVEERGRFRIVVERWGKREIGKQNRRVLPRG